MTILKGNTAPTTATPGFVGDYYIDLSTDIAYKCTSVETASDTYGFLKIDDATLSDSVYIWTELGGSNATAGGSDNMLATFTITKKNDGSGNYEAVCDKTFEECLEAGNNETLAARYVYHETSIGSPRKYVGTFTRYHIITTPTADGDIPYCIQFKTAWFGTTEGDVIDIVLYVIDGVEGIDVVTDQL